MSAVSVLGCTSTAVDRSRRTEKKTMLQSACYCSAEKEEAEAKEDEESATKTAASPVAGVSTRAH